jgi:hypothetical protein
MTLFNLRGSALILAVVAAISFFIGYKVAPREILDSTVKHVGWLTIDTERVLSATVESLKSESRLVSYSYIGTQRVSINRSSWYIFKGNQELIVPATVSYFVDLSKLNKSSAVFDEVTNTVRVKLPKLMLSVDFDPRRATIINSGLITLNDSVVQELTKLNYDTARKSAIKQGQQAELFRLAKERTSQNIEQLFRVPLQATGKDAVKIVVSFPN